MSGHAGCSQCSYLTNPYPVLKPLSLGLVRQTRTTRAAIQKGQPRYLSLGPRRTSGPENAVDGTLCDGLLTVMEQPSRRGISLPFLLRKYLEHQAQACRQIDRYIAFTLVGRCFSTTDQSQAFGHNSRHLL